MSTKKKTKVGENRSYTGRQGRKWFLDSDAQGAVLRTNGDFNKEAGFIIRRWGGEFHPEVLAGWG